MERVSEARVSPEPHAGGSDGASCIDPALRERVLGFEAPALIEKLVDTGVAASAAQATLLFDELKKYFLLTRHIGAALPMNSALVDAAWHQFVLFTRDYERFCRERLGAFCHHLPTVHTQVEVAVDAGPSWALYVQSYEAHFGSMPDVWHDAECLRTDTRLRRAHGAEVLAVAVDGRGFSLVRGAGEVVCRVSARARAALDFIAAHPCFLVRELPDLRDAEERLSLARPLVRYRILRIAV